MELIVKTDSNVSLLANAFSSTKSITFANLLEPLLRLVSHSTRVNQALADRTPFVRKLITRLEHHSNNVSRLAMLKILTTLLEQNNNPQSLIQTHNLQAVLKKLADDSSAVLVQNLASSLLSKYGQ